MIIIGLWFLCSIITIIGLCLFDYFVEDRDISLEVGEILPMLFALCMGPITFIVVAIQMTSNYTEKYQSRIIFKIKRKQK